MPHLVHIATVPDSLIFLAGQVSFMKRLGFEVTVVTSPGEALDRFGADEGVATLALEMPRRITPLQDLKTVARLAAKLRRLRPDIVHAHTPKGGLLGILSARMAGVPVRLYHMRGLPFVTARGWRRTLLKTTERISCTFATRVICQSPSLRAVAEAEEICDGAKMEVVGGGSNGVDSAVRFNPDRDSNARSRTRNELGIPADARVVGFVGRLVRDKGIVELATAWRRLRDEHPTAHLLLVGPFEPQDPVPHEIRRALESDERVHVVGFTSDTPRYYAAMDVVVLPTYREGFPNVPLEAAAMSLPVVATEVPGCTDAVKDGETGTLVPVRDAGALADAIGAYVRDRQLAVRHGAAGRERVRREFRRERIYELMSELYERELARAGIRWSASGAPVRGAMG